MKLCTSCGKRKDTSDFYRDARRYDGLYASCKDCHRTKVKSYAEAHHTDTSFRCRKFFQYKRHVARSYPKVSAKRKVNSAVKSGKLIKPAVCSRTNWLCGGRIEAHHPDYTLPLHVLWLCKTHHQLEHKALLVN